MWVLLWVWCCLWWLCQSELERNGIRGAGCGPPLLRGHWVLLVWAVHSPTDSVAKESFAALWITGPRFEPSGGGWDCPRAGQDCSLLVPTVPHRCKIRGPQADITPYWAQSIRGHRSPSVPGAEAVETPQTRSLSAQAPGQHGHRHTLMCIRLCEEGGSCPERSLRRAPGKRVWG